MGSLVVGYGESVEYGSDGLVSVGSMVVIAW